jgi:heme exporter protein D
MGGYAAYVWSSYAIALVLLVANLMLPMQQHRKLLQRLGRRIRRTGK